MTSYRGRPIEYAVHNRKADTYSLIDGNGDCVAELKARKFMSIPNRGNLEVRSGRYRSAGSKDQRRADRVAGQPGRDDALDTSLFASNPLWTNPVIASAPTGKHPGLTGVMINQLAQQARNSMTNALFGKSPFFNPMLDELQHRPALKRDGVVAGEIVGYRCWRIEHGFLRSVYQSDVWKPGEILQGRELGDWDSRGIHAWKDSGSKEYHAYIRGYLNRENDPFSMKMILNYLESDDYELRPAMVTGTVFLWGDVVEHERGWRAEFARVRSLDWLYPDAKMMGREQDALQGLRLLYGLLPKTPGTKPAHG